MKNSILLVCALLIATVGMTGCGSKADETKPIDQVKAEAAKMDVEQLKSMAEKYKDAIMAKQKEVEKIAAQIKEIPLTEMLGDKAKNLKAQIDEIGKSVSALKERMDVYVDKLKELKADVSNLSI